MKKKIVVGAIIVIAIALALVLMTRNAHACGNWWGCGDNTYISEQQAIEQNQQRLLKTEPLPYTNDSQERKNLIRRVKTFNNSNKISYIYLYSQMGTFIMYDTVKGKVSSVDSSLTAQQQLLDEWGNPINGDDHYCGSQGCNVVSAPAADGSYGTNGSGIFWYNESGAYREWNGLYFLSDQPFTPQTTPNLVVQSK
jgi:hypothetical protein